MCLNFKTLNEFSFGAIVATEENAVDFVLKCGLVKYDSIDCNECQHKMRLEKKTVSSLHYDFRCTNFKCLKFISGTTNTWFYGSNLKWQTILQIMFMWCEKRTLTNVIKLLHVSNKTAIKWFNFCRGICAIVLSNENSAIGGPGLTVEIDETHLFTRKYNRGRLLKREQVWIFGGICRENNDMFVVPVKQRNKDTLIPLITKYVKDNSIIYSDCWKAYSGIKGLNYTHDTVNHKEEFVKHIGNRVISSQKIERMWRDIKDFIPKYTAEKSLEPYLIQYMYFKKYNCETVGERFEMFINHIKLVYPGPNKIGLKLLEL